MSLSISKITDQLPYLSLSRYYPWQVAAPMILSAVVFLQPLPDAAQSKLQKKYMPKKVSSQILTSQFLIHNVGQCPGVRLRIINGKTGQLCVGCMFGAASVLLEFLGSPSCHL